ncbi:MAG: hypothetical protein ACTSSK_17190 [Candidatus Heimdallarchaeota archaeon]
MKYKKGKIFVLLIIVGLGMFFVPKVNTTTALIVETHTIAYNEYIEANAGIIAGDGFLWFYYTQNNSDIELEVWLMNNAEYNNFVQYGSGLHYLMMEVLMMKMPVVLSLEQCIWKKKITIVREDCSLVI